MSRQQPGSYEVLWTERRRRDRIELRVTPYANGGGDVRLVRVGPRGGEDLLHYVGGAQSAKDVKEFIRARRRWDSAFLEVLNHYYPEV